MNKDIRLSVDFFDHPKTMKLLRSMGMDALICLQRLWCFAGKYRPDGTLSDMEEIDIEFAARWTGEHGEFVSGMVKLKWIDCADGVYILHDWHDHNGFAVHAKEREDQARKAAEKRWKKRYGSSDVDADSNAHSNADSNPVSNAPSPTPDPIPIPDPSPDPIPSPTTTTATESVETDRMTPGELRKRYEVVTKRRINSGSEITVLQDLCRDFTATALIEGLEKTAAVKPDHPLPYFLKRMRNKEPPMRNKTDYEALIREHEAEEARNGLPVHG